MAKKRLFPKLIVMLLLVAILLPNFSTLAYATSMEVVSTTTHVRKGIVTANSLNFREGPSLSSKIISVIRKGTTVNILEEHGEWLQIEYETQIGYVHSQHIEALQSHGITTATRLNVRAEPTVTSESIDLLHKGTRVSILEEFETNNSINPVWLKVSYLDGQTGYISKRYVNVLTTQYGDFRTIGVTTAQLLNVRSEPGTSAKVTTMLFEGSYVFILDSCIIDDYYDQWYKIDYNGHIGWVAGKYLDVKEWVSSAKSSTTNRGSAKNRNDNMKLATSTLTGTIVLPGEEFSWIRTMASCSAEKGYKIATVFVNGKPTEGYGGGVCQVSTTLNIAIKKLGIPTNASTHSLEEGYASREDEASVSYPNLDFSFTNTLDTPILVEMNSNNGTVSCNIYIAE